MGTGPIGLAVLLGIIQVRGAPGSGHRISAKPPANSERGKGCIEANWSVVGQADPRLDFALRSYPNQDWAARPISPLRRCTWMVLQPFELRAVQLGAGL